MVTKVSKSYEYNAICDRCGFKKKSYELRKEWDGFMVCKECWEPRHILDFYRTKNDVHKLPFTRPDIPASAGGGELTWTPIFDNLIETPGTGTITKYGTYRIANNILTYNITIVLTGNAQTSSFIPPLFYTLPVLPVVTAGTSNAIRDNVMKGTQVIAVGASFANYTNVNWFNSTSNLSFNGSYGV